MSWGESFSNAISSIGSSIANSRVGKSISTAFNAVTRAVTGGGGSEKPEYLKTTAEKQKDKENAQKKSEDSAKSFGASLWDGVKEFGSDTADFFGITDGKFGIDDATNSREERAAANEAAIARNKDLAPDEREALPFDASLSNVGQALTSPPAVAFVVGAAAEISIGLAKTALKFTGAVLSTPGVILGATITPIPGLKDVGKSLTGLPGNISDLVDGVFDGKGAEAFSEFFGTVKDPAVDVIERADVNGDGAYTGADVVAGARNVVNDAVETGQTILDGKVDEMVAPIVAGLKDVQNTADTVTAVANGATDARENPGALADGLTATIVGKPAADAARSLVGDARDSSDDRTNAAAANSEPDTLETVARDETANPGGFVTNRSEVENTLGVEGVGGLGLSFDRFDSEGTGTTPPNAEPSNNSQQETSTNLASVEPVTDANPTATARDTIPDISNVDELSHGASAYERPEQPSIGPEEGSEYAQGGFQPATPETPATPPRDTFDPNDSDNEHDAPLAGQQRVSVPPVAAASQVSTFAIGNELTYGQGFQAASLHMGILILSDDADAYVDYLGDAGYPASELEKLVADARNQAQQIAGPYVNPPSVDFGQAAELALADLKDGNHPDKHAQLASDATKDFGTGFYAIEAGSQALLQAYVGVDVRADGPLTKIADALTESANQTAQYAVNTFSDLNELQQDRLENDTSYTAENAIANEQVITFVAGYIATYGLDAAEKHFENVMSANRFTSTVEATELMEASFDAAKSLVVLAEIGEESSLQRVQSGAEAFAGGNLTAENAMNIVHGEWQNIAQTREAFGAADSVQLADVGVTGGAEVADVALNNSANGVARGANQSQYV